MRPDRRTVIRTLVPAALVGWLPARVLAADPGFALWLSAFRAEAGAHGISQATLDSALDGLVPLDRVLELDHKQPESTITFERYLERTVSADRVAAGRRRLDENRDLFEKVERRWGVPPQFVAALWGLESDFGAAMGNFPVIGALATLAYASSRPDLFRSELLAALKILDKDRIQPSMLRGSWAGAMGQTQFMPSSYLRYAVDFDDTGHADIWSDRADVLASIANYLASEGWERGAPWGRRVRLPAGFDLDLIDYKRPRPLAEWASLGVLDEAARPLPREDRASALVQPGGPGGPTLLVFQNYRVLMKWNHSTYFATAVVLLAERLAA